MKKAFSLFLAISILFVSINAHAQTKAPLSDSAKAAKKAARAEKKAEKAKASAATTTTPAVTPAVTPAPAPAVKPAPATTPKTVTQGVNKTADKVVGTDAKGRTIYEGKKGGRYTLTAAGNKEYIKKTN